MTSGRTAHKIACRHSPRIGPNQAGRTPVSTVLSKWLFRTKPSA